MKVSERILLILVSLVVIALLAGLVACLWSENLEWAVHEFFSASYGIYVKIAATGVAAVLAVLLIRLWFSGLGASENATAARVASTDAGGIYINLSTISDLATKAVKKTEGVLQTTVRTKIGNEGAIIAVRASLASDAVIPEVSAGIQKNVKTDIETYCGLPVAGITVQIDNTRKD